MRPPQAIWLAAILATAGWAAAAEPPPLDESLAWSNLDGRDFHERDLRRHNLSMTSFNRADFHGADFAGSDLDRTDFDDANLSGTKGWAAVDFGMGLSAMRANFQHADLSHAKIPGTYFEQADFRHADLHDAVLAGRFHDANFADADVRGTVVLGACGIESQLDDLRRRGAITTPEDFVTALRSGRDFSGCRLGGFRLDGMNLDGVTIRDADLSDTGLVGATLARSDLTGSRLGPWMDGVNLTGATLDGAFLFRAELREANLSHATCRMAKFCWARLHGADLTGTDLTGADFSGADLTGVNLSGAILDGVRWDDAIIADLRGVSPERAAALKTQAARWRFELERRFDRFLSDWSIPLWFICWPFGAVCLVRGCRHAANRLPFALLACLHGSAPLLPVLGWLTAWWPPTYLATIIVFPLGLIAALPVTLLAWISWWRRSPRASPALLALTTFLVAVSLVAAYAIGAKTIPME